MPIDDENNDVTEEQVLPDNPPATEAPVADEPPAAENPVTEENPVTDAPTVEVSGAIKHQSEFNTDNGEYTQKTGATLDIKEGDNSYSAGLYVKTPESFQIEGIYSRNLFSTNITPQDNFGVSAAYRNQANFSTSGVSDQNRVSVQQNYTHKFDNGWRVGAYANENAKVTFSGNGASASVGYIAGVSAGKGRVSGYAEHQGDWRLTGKPGFGSYVNVGLKVSL